MFLFYEGVLKLPIFFIFEDLIKFKNKYKKNQQQPPPPKKNNFKKRKDPV